MSYEVLKFLHVLGAIVILGTGTGIAFFMLMAHRSADAQFIGRTAAVVVKADMIFTATAVVVQPVTGYLLMQVMDLSFSQDWLEISLALYLLAGVFWLPVVWIQARMRDLRWRPPVPLRHCPRVTIGSIASGLSSDFPASGRCC